MKKSYYLLTCLAVSLLLSGCVVTSDDGPKPAPVYTMKLTVDRMIANLTCEGDGTEQLADLYTQLLISEGTSYPPTVAVQDYTLVQLGLAEQTTNTGLALEAEVEFEDKTQFNATISSYENDPSGWDLSTIFGKSVVFDEAEGCWKLEGVCINGSTEFPHVFKLPFYHRMSNNRCDIEYFWTLELVAD